MNGPRQRGKKYWWLVISSIIFLVMGCVSREKGEFISLSAAVPQNTIKKIAVEENAEGKRVLIEGESPLPYTFTKLISQPMELVIDIPQATLAQEATVPIIVNDGII